MRRRIRNRFIQLVSGSKLLTRFFLSVSSRLLDEKFSQVNQESYIRLLSILKPSENSFPLKRFGCEGDGGYVLVNSIKPETVCFSLGIAQEISFDISVAPCVSHIHMFDYSVASPPTCITNSTFYKLRVVRKTQNPQSEIDLGTIFENFSLNCPIILKVDIEGSEWEVFLGLSSENIGRCDQIIVEFHGIQNLPLHPKFETYVGFLKELSQSHTIVNTHINNWGRYDVIKGIPVPDVLEVTFVKKDMQRDASDDFHGKLNYPNNPSRSEFHLYPFKGILS